METKKRVLDADGVGMLWGKVKRLGVHHLGTFDSQNGALNAAAAKGIVDDPDKAVLTARIRGAGGKDANIIILNQVNNGGASMGQSEVTHQIILAGARKLHRTVSGITSSTPHANPVLSDDAHTLALEKDSSGTWQLKLKDWYGVVMTQVDLTSLINDIAK